VYFPEDGDRAELRILSQEPNQLERVIEDVTTPDAPPDHAEVAPEAASSADAASTEDAHTEAASGGDKLSQEELDKLFG
jgi:hypothetical protein